jgi:hypothetical protein
MVCIVYYFDLLKVRFIILLYDMGYTQLGPAARPKDVLQYYQVE